jgi:long-chain acyl-CoA synthetase
MRLATNGGEPVRQSTIEEFEERFGIRSAVMPGYGLAEATLGVTSAVPGEPLVVDPRGNVSCGPVRPCVEVRAGSDLSAPGEILVRGESVFAGYFEAPKETEEVLRDGWLHTGDIGYLDDAGRLFVLGRKRVMIKRGGAVVAPRELEEAAQDVKGVRVAAAVGLPDATNLTETAVVVVEAGREGSDTLAADVSHAVAAAVGFAPGRVAVLEPRAIPRTENGKIRHDRLRELLLERFSVEAAE